MAKRYRKARFLEANE